MGFADYGNRSLINNRNLISRISGNFVRFSASAIKTKATYQTGVDPVQRAFSIKTRKSIKTIIFYWVVLIIISIGTISLIYQWMA